MQMFLAWTTWFYLWLMEVEDMFMMHIIVHHHLAGPGSWLALERTAMLMGVRPRINGFLWGHLVFVCVLIH